MEGEAHLVEVHLLQAGFLRLFLLLARFLRDLESLQVVVRLGKLIARGVDRPADFDEQVIKRYGAAKADYRNPYPMPGEDPNKTNGGSGQLPLGFMQDKNADGKWNGLIGSTCSACHDSRLGTPEERPFAFGRSNDEIGRAHV